MNPSQAFANRTARLAREATTPVYSTTTPAPKQREHMVAVETESLYGRHWSTMKESEVEAFISRLDDWFPGCDERGTFLSDMDHSAQCWCQK